MPITVLVKIEDAPQATFPSFQLLIVPKGKKK
jgi:hypothetical protein